LGYVIFYGNPLIKFKDAIIDIFLIFEGKAVSFSKISSKYIIILFLS